MKTRSKRGTVKRKTPTTQDLKPESSDSVSRRSFTKADPANHSPDISVPKKNSPRSTARIASPNQERGASFPLLLAKRGEGRDEEPQGTRGNSAPVLDGLRGEMVPKAQAENSLDSLSRRSQTKADPTKLLESALTARRKSQTELTNLRQLLADKSAQAAALETTGDLHDPAVLAEIGRLQILTVRQVAGGTYPPSDSPFPVQHVNKLNETCQSYWVDQTGTTNTSTKTTLETHTEVVWMAKVEETGLWPDDGPWTVWLKTAGSKTGCNRSDQGTYFWAPASIGKSGSDTVSLGTPNALLNYPFYLANDFYK